MPKVEPFHVDTRMDSIQMLQCGSANISANPDQRSNMWSFRMVADGSESFGLQRIRMGPTGPVPLESYLTSHRCAAAIKDRMTGFRLVVTSPPDHTRKYS